MKEQVLWFVYASKAELLMRANGEGGACRTDPIISAGLELKQQLIQNAQTIGPERQKKGREKGLHVFFKFRYAFSCSVAESTS